MSGPLNGSRTLILGALVLFIVSVLLVVAGTGYAVWQGQRQGQALCAEQGDIGTAPLTAMSNELGVKLIVDFRDAYAGLGCSPALPPPPAELRRLAKRYGILVRH